MKKEEEVDGTEAMSEEENAGIDVLKKATKEKEKKTKDY